MGSCLLLVPLSPEGVGLDNVIMTKFFPTGGVPYQGFIPDFVLGGEMFCEAA